MSEGGRRRREGEGDEGNEHGRPQLDDAVGGEARVAKKGRGSAPFKRPREAERLGVQSRVVPLVRGHTTECTRVLQVFNPTIDVNCVLSR